MRESELRKLMDAVGPEPCDEELWHSPELASLRRAVNENPTVKRDWERIQEWDRVLQQSLQQGSVPEGLEDRLLAAVTEAGTPKDESGVTHREKASSKSPIDDDSASSPVSLRSDRRRIGRWGILVGTIGASLLLCLTWVWMQGVGTPVTMPELTDAAAVAITRLPSSGWQTTDLPLRSHPPDHVLRLSRRLSWQQVSFLGDPQAVVYRDTGYGRPIHVIVTTPPRLEELPELPPDQPQKLTGTAMVAAWQPAGGPVNILVFDGDQRSYQQLIRPLTVAQMAPSLFGIY